LIWLPDSKEIEVYDLEKYPFQWNNLSRKYSTTPFYCVKKWMKSQGDLGQETELAALERQRRGKKKGASQKKNKSYDIN